MHSSDSLQWLNDLMNSKEYGDALTAELKRHIIRHIVKYDGNTQNRDTIYVMDESTGKPKEHLQSPVILNISVEKIDGLAKMVKEILPFTSRININIYDLGVKRYVLFER